MQPVTTETHAVGIHQLTTADHEPSITNHQASDGSCSISAEPNATGTVKHHTNSCAGTGSYARPVLKFMALTALAVLNNALTVAGQSNSTFNGATGTNADSDAQSTTGTHSGTSSQYILGGLMVGVVALGAVACTVAKNYFSNASQNDDQEAPAGTDRPVTAEEVFRPPPLSFFNGYSGM